MIETKENRRREEKTVLWNYTRKQRKIWVPHKSSDRFLGGMSHNLKCDSLIRREVIGN